MQEKLTKLLAMLMRIEVRGESNLSLLLGGIHMLQSMLEEMQKEQENETRGGV